MLYDPQINAQSTGIETGRETGKEYSVKRTHPRRGALPMAVLVIAGLASIALPTGAAAAAPAELAATAVYSGGVDFRPNVDFGGATLTVSGNGRVFQQAFAAGDNISIGMFDPEGQPLADGVYSWQLDLLPDAATARELRRAASLTGGKPDGAWQALTGSFAIRGGVIADQRSAEAQQRTGSRPQSGLRSALTPSSLGSSRGAAEDDDTAVGSRSGAEEQINAAAARLRAPIAAGGALLQADRAASEDTDATSVAFGQALEPAAALDENQLSAQSRRAPTPRPRSDGSNGRPRS